MAKGSGLMWVCHVFLTKYYDENAQFSIPVRGPTFDLKIFCYLNGIVLEVGLYWERGISDEVLARLLPSEKIFQILRFYIIEK